MKIKVWNLLDGRKHAAAIVGAGGKTTVMYELAAYLSSQGKKVLAATTTHIYKPCPEVYAADVQQLQDLWQRGSYAVCGRQAQAPDKLTMPEPELLTEFMRLADIILLEADGAKGRPCKAPAAHEPVIPHQCDIVIGVLGLDAVGQKVAQACFRPQLVQQLLNCGSEHILTPEDAAVLLMSADGLRKNVGERNYYLVLNKCDTEERARIAGRICEILAYQGLQKDAVWIRGAWQDE